MVAAVAAALVAGGQPAMGDMGAAPRGEQDSAAGQGWAAWVDRRPPPAAGAADEEAQRERRARAAGAARAAGEVAVARRRALPVVPGSRAGAAPAPPEPAAG